MDGWIWRLPCVFVDALFKEEPYANEQCVLIGTHCTLTRKMSVQSFRMRSTQGSSSNMMEWDISLKKPRTNFPMTRTTDTYRPMILGGEIRKEKQVYNQEKKTIITIII